MRRKDTYINTSLTTDDKTTNNMQQAFNSQLLCKIGSNGMIKRYSSYASNMLKTIVEEQHADHDLICPKWEEEIVREHRTPDLPFDILQKMTIDMINNKSFVMEEDLFSN